MYRSNSSQSSIHSFDGTLGGFNRSQAESRTVLGGGGNSRAAIAGPKAAARGAHTRNLSYTFSGVPAAEEPAVHEQLRGGTIQLEDLIHEMKGNSLHNMLQEPD